MYQIANNSDKLYAANKDYVCAHNSDMKHVKISEKG